MLPEHPADFAGAPPAAGGPADAAPPAPRVRRRDPVLSRDVGDVTFPGVVVEVVADEAASLGAFTESALSEDDAWESNADLEPPEAPRGG